MFRRGGADGLWRVAAFVTALILVWFGAFELLERAWIGPGERELMKVLHLARGIGSSLLALAVTLYLARSGAMALPERSDSSRPVERAASKAAWLIQLRWLAAVAVVAAVAFSRSFHWIERGAELRLWAGAGALFAFNAWLVLTRSRHGAAGSSVRLHLAFDSLALVYLLHHSGGVENPFSLLLVFHGQVGAILLDGRDAARLAAWSGALLVCLGLGEMTGLLAHHPLLLAPHAPGAACLARTPGSLGPIIAAFLVVHAGTTLFTARLMARLRMENERILAAERLSAVGRIVGFVAHEVNNPIGVISTKAHLALSRPQQLADPERMRASMEVIARQADRVAGIVQMLLAGARPASARLRELSLGEVVDEVVERLAPRFMAAGVSLRRSGAPAVLLRDARFSEVAQALSALLLNALEASAPADTVRLEVSARDDWAELSVADNGPGIPKEDLERVFEPFFSTKRARGGGLSLAMCRALAAGLGGEILARSAPGKGSEFILRLPGSAGAGAAEA